MYVIVTCNANFHSELNSLVPVIVQVKHTTIGELLQDILHCTVFELCEGCVLMLQLFLLYVCLLLCDLVLGRNGENMLMFGPSCG